MKPILILSHIECEPPGYFSLLLNRLGYPYQQLCLSQDVEAPQTLEQYAGLIFMGGPGNVEQPTDWMLKEMSLIQLAHQQEIPMLGVCLGAQLISKALGGEVWQAEEMEVGWHPVKMLPSALTHPLIEKTDPVFTAFHWHAHTCSPPPGAEPIATSDCTDCQGFIFDSHLAVQFHLEMTEEIICELLEKYAGDIENPSCCVQHADAIRKDIAVRCQQSFAVADQLFTPWLNSLHQ